MDIQRSTGDGVKHGIFSDQEYVVAHVILLLFRKS